MWLWIFVSFYGGFLFGMFISALAMAAHDEDDPYK